jgi:hypothetical protein
MDLPIGSSSRWFGGRRNYPLGGSLDHSVTLKFGEQLREKIASVSITKAEPRVDARF